MENNLRCYMVTFHTINGEGVVDFLQTFYVENTIELAEQIMEYQEELEDTLDIIIVSKDIQKITCEENGHAHQNRQK